MHTQTFRGLDANGVSELIGIFGAKCHSWDKVTGYAEVDFDSQEEAELFVQNHEFTES